MTHARDVATRCLTPRRFFRGWYPRRARLGNFTAGDVGVTMQWVNDNVAPTYLRWQVVFVLDGPVHIELPRRST